MGDYRRLHVWQRAHQLVLSIYSATRTFPRDECFGLVVQMRRAAVSIPANLAEGCGRDTDPEIVRYARIALGSASELEYYLQLSRDLGYLPDEEGKLLNATLVETKLMLAGLARALAGVKHG